MNHSDRIYVAGHNGLVGSSIVRRLLSQGFTNLIVCTHNELDLTSQSDVQSFFKKEQPDYVILAAAKVGGIYANNTYPADFIYQNIMIEANVIHAAYENQVKSLLFLSSTCIYPKHVQQPMSENSLLSGVLEPTNEPYAIAKIAGIKLCESYNRQYNTDFRSIIPTNLYGINDNFDSENAHVIQSLMMRFHNAKINNEAEVNVWGTGNARREFLYVDDMSEAALFLFELDKVTYQKHIQPMLSHINVGTGIDVTIKDMAEALREVVGFKGKLVFDSSKPEGIKRKLINTDKLRDIGWVYSTTLKEGLKKTYDWFLVELESKVVK